MATKKNKKKKKKKKKSKLKKVVSKKAAPKKKAALKKNAGQKKRVAKKTPAKKAPPKKATLKKSGVRGKSQDVATVAFEREGKRARTGGQSGDLQGLSRRAGADSESVDELLEEGNAFEAEIVEGVEDAPDADEGEVETHEVPEDDVREEYLDDKD